MHLFQRTHVSLSSITINEYHTRREVIKRLEKRGGSGRVGGGCGEKDRVRREGRREGWRVQRGRVMGWAFSPVSGWQKQEFFFHPTVYIIIIQNSTSVKDPGVQGLSLQYASLTLWMFCSNVYVTDANASSKHECCPIRAWRKEEDKEEGQETDWLI